MSQESKAESADSKDQAPSRDEKERLFLGRYANRVRFDLGIGYARLYQPILDEAGPSWLINSALRSAGDPTRPIALPYDSPDYNRSLPRYWGVEYSWKDRIDVSYSRRFVSREFKRQAVSTADFFQADSPNYTWSLFEGLRLLKYHLNETEVELAYYHPITAKLRVGPLIRRETFDEIDSISLGSYQLRKAADSVDPGLRVWSIAGDGRAHYTLHGWQPGFGVKWYSLPWLQFRYRLYLISRKGDFNLAGPQLMQTETSGGVDDYLLLYPAYSGTATEKGTRHHLEAVLSKCRFSLTFGLMKEDTQRSYGSYIGDTIGNVRDVSLKSGNYGIGEGSSSFAGHALEFYMKLGTSFHF